MKTAFPNAMLHINTDQIKQKKAKEHKRIRQDKIRL